MKTFFEVIPSNFDAAACSLTCEVSDEGVSFCIKDLDEKKFIGIAVYNYDRNRAREEYNIALQILLNTKPFLSQPFQKVTVVYSLPEAVLIPFSLYDSSKMADYLALVCGKLTNESAVMSDVITEQSYFNCFRVPHALAHAIDEKFPEKTNFHQHSKLLGSHSSDENKLSVIFYSYKMVVTLFKDGRCHLVNSYNYQFAEDVSFYLLSIREQHDLHGIPVHVSGFIEKDSSLYIELYKYFEEVLFAPLPPLCEYSPEVAKYPSHYFSHLFELDPCV